MENTRCKPHAIIFPVPYQGHINPTVNLTLKLASTHFAITFVNTEYVHQKLSKIHHNNITSNEFDLFLEARKSGLDIRYKTISDGLPLDFDRENFDEYWMSFLEVFPSIMDEFVGNLIKSDTSVVSFLIADTFFPCAADVAKKHNLVHVSFWTQPALVFAIDYHMDLLAEKGHYPCKDDAEEEINYVPGVESINTKDLMPYIMQSAVGTMVFRVGFETFKEVKKSDIILHYTVQELETKTLESLSKIKPSFAIGPITSFTNPPKLAIPKSLWSEFDCSEWLDSKPVGSVLYVSLGSLVPTSEKAIQELAHGLLLSEVNFIWVFRANLVKSSRNEILPIGFEDKIKDRGLVVPWCNQIVILSHPAVGGFLTHCGFNSTLESMWCGVPMICYPIIFDQPTVRKLIVEDWKIGINLCEGTSVSREEAAENIKSLMNGTSSETLRQEVKKIMTILQNALEVDGSTHRNFDKFIKEVEFQIYSKNG